MKPIGDRHVILDETINVANPEEFKNQIKVELQKWVDKYIAKFGESKIKPNETSVFTIPIGKSYVYASFKGDGDITVKLK